MEQAKRLDAESGLYPQGMLETLLAHEVARSRRYPSPISLVYFALRFVRNPTPEILESAQVTIATHLHSIVREADMPGHYEGNYLVVMPATDCDGAIRAAQRMMSDYPKSHMTRTAELFEMSLCVGIASDAGGPSISSSQLLSNVSEALWEAQRQGPRSLVVYGKSQSKAA